MGGEDKLLTPLGSADEAPLIVWSLRAFEQARGVKSAMWW